MSESLCPHQHECVNYDDRCFQCEDQERLFKTKKSRVAPKKPKKMNPFGKVASGEVKQGIDFENKVASQYNKYMGNTPRQKARRVPGSGAIWCMPGDVITMEALIECKDRGTMNARGEKQFTVKKDWMDKVWLESIGTKKAPVLMFRFGEEEKDTYAVMNLNVLLEMMFNMQELKNRIRQLEE